jgi:hypothetical protein
MLTENILFMLPGPYEFLIIVFMWGLGALLPIVYAVYAIRQRHHILSEIERLRQDVQELGQRLDRPPRSEGGV